MRKKYLSALLFGVALTTATGTFVSCSDYDDDIQNLQEQIDKLASADDVKNAISDMNAAVAQAKSEAEAKAAAAQAVADAAKAAAEKAQGSADGAQAVADAAAAKAAELEANGATKAEVEAAQAAADKAAAAASQAAADADAAIQAAKEEALAAAKAAQDAADKVAASATELAKSVAELEQNGADKASVATAQAAADAAAAAAKKAQETADAAKTAAANAQTAADAAATAAQAAATDASSALSKIEDIDTRLTTLENKVNNMSNDAIETNISTLQNDVKTLQNDLKAIIGEYSTMVTSVALWTADHNATWDHSGIFGEDTKECGDHFLTFTKIVEEDNVFPADKNAADRQYTFTKGNSVTYTADIIIRVSPTTAILNKDNISLINSQGAELSDLVYADEVEPYTELLTMNSRAVGANNGLWKVTFKLKPNYDAEAFEKAVSVKQNDVTKAIRFAVAVKNTQTQEDADDRRVISGYELGVKATDGYHANNSILINETSINYIHNRYSACEDGTSTSRVKELVWTAGLNYAATTVITEGDKQNADDRYKNFDNRQTQPILPVVQGEPISIKIDWNTTKNAPNNQIKGFYVTLDENFALESVPSEINAWNSYEYENLGVLQDGNSGTITIKDTKNVTGDIIGFRIYAVNLDGTLMDPDGRAFYVVVGDLVQDALIEGTVVANKQFGASTDFIDVEGYFTAASWGNGWNIDIENNPKLNGNNSPAFTVTYYDKDKKQTWGPNNEDIKYVKLSMDNAADYIDGQTYTQTMTLQKYVYVSASKGEYIEGWIWDETRSQYYYIMDLKVITAKLTKVLPTAFPSDFAFRPKQEITDGSGKFRAYMIPENGYAVTTMSDNGLKDLSNVFYGLDENYSFTFKTSDKDANGVKDLAPVVYSGREGDRYIYTLSINQNPNKFIDNSTEHEVVANYLYRNVSTYYDADKNVWNIGVDHPVTYNKPLTAIYACWHNASRFEWNTGKEPSLQWSAEGTTKPTPLADVISKNSYNNDYFGKDLNVLVNTNQWLKIKDGSLKLTVNGQVNPYFVPSLSGQNFVFTQKGTQVDAAPLDDHKETLEFIVIDAFNHETSISLAVTIKKPTTK